MLRLDWFLRMILAALCGGIIGFERKSKAKNAGIRTHALIAVGAAMVMIISKYGFFDLIKITHSNWNVDPSRIAAQVVSGIGFLGAGTIINRHDQIIDGLTTAAGIWVTGAIGLAYGSGLYSIGVIGTSCVLIAEVTGKYLDQFALRQGNGFSCFIQLVGDTKVLRAIIDQLNQKYFKVPLKYTLYDYENGKITCQLYGELKPGIKPENIFTDLTTLENIKSVELE
ncbi:MgtC/SapB family protein [Limosilactobacillus agrestis]|uniref:MgtC/SapB family protein n=1 Tax=Limosilactobacillus agrestis TaxID=2759748 RepID=A0A7W3UHG6_9LACO|nr:MgtC/SapB family protein [Limosilactobacillus agrestis]MBD5090820.1 methyltransferase [Lactobacillus sp.]MBB1095586.1 MgtC/SapB family protein [Limosilactobacillus agrestis]MBB1100229.1 MgtC/SapB family protein [Limosilactobacillus agrestis]MCD7112699.1 MgtC/SapB family protein [Limosilactobacillus agrestis]MCD7120712.1 MgtC/SapB family protein [Limosilactobacillus agrestis]